jgi:hypothetical protein
MENRSNIDAGVFETLASHLEKINGRSLAEAGAYTDTVMATAQVA